jgi:prevent-host-death family protein
MTDARHDFTAIANTVTFKGERVIIEKNNKPAFAVVPMEDIELLEKIEDRLDVLEALEALKDEGSVSLEELRKKLGL